MKKKFAAGGKPRRGPVQCLVVVPQMLKHLDRYYPVEAVFCLEVSEVNRPHLQVIQPTLLSLAGNELSLTTGVGNGRDGCGGSKQTPDHASTRFAHKRSGIQLPEFNGGCSNRFAGRAKRPFRSAGSTDPIARTTRPIGCP